MGNDIVLQKNNWEVFELNDNQKKFDNFVDVIKTLDNGAISTDLWTKWKGEVNQIVIQTPNYYFKIYNDEFTTGEFNSLIREKLAEIYREDCGLLWDIKTIYNDNKLYQIERREKLHVCQEGDISFDDLMLKWNNILKKLEQKLLLPQITKQLQDSIPDLYEIKLVRECLNKFEDYGLTNNGDVVLLDDADWFLAFVDKEHNWMNKKFSSYHILTSIGDRIIAPSNYYEVLSYNDINKMNILCNKWMIMRIEEDLIVTEQNLREKEEQMLYDNIKLLSSGKKLENKCLSIFPTSDQLYVKQISPDPMERIASNGFDRRCLGIQHQKDLP